MRRLPRPRRRPAVAGPLDRRLAGSQVGAVRDSRRRCQPGADGLYRVSAVGRIRNSPGRNYLPQRHRVGSRRRLPDVFVDRPVHRQPRHGEQLPRRASASRTQQTITVVVHHGHGGTASATIRLGHDWRSVHRHHPTPVDSAFGQRLPVHLHARHRDCRRRASGHEATPSSTTHVVQLPPIPSNLQAGSPPIYFDGFTDAAFLPAPINIYMTRAA